MVHPVCLDAHELIDSFVRDVLTDGAHTSQLPYATQTLVWTPEDCFVCRKATTVCDIGLEVASQQFWVHSLGKPDWNVC